MKLGTPLSEWEEYYVIFPRRTINKQFVFCSNVQRRKVYAGMAMSECGGFGTYKWEYKL